MRVGWSVNMKFVIVVVFTVALTSTTVQGRFNIKRRRQSSACLLTYLTLSSDERDCLPLDSDTFSADQLETLCSSETCITATKKLLKGCKVIQCLCHMCCMYSYV